MKYVNCGTSTLNIGGRKVTPGQEVELAEVPSFFIKIRALKPAKPAAPKPAAVDAPGTIEREAPPPRRAPKPRKE